MHEVMLIFICEGEERMYKDYRLIYLHLPVYSYLQYRIQFTNCPVFIVLAFISVVQDDQVETPAMK